MSAKPPYSYSKNKYRYLMSLGANQGWHCHYCHRLMMQPGVGEMLSTTATIDHKEPVSAGGSYEVSNLVVCCKSCNSRKNKHKSHDEFFALMTEQRIANGGEA